jgi:hypothetical protein
VITIVNNERGLMKGPEDPPVKAWIRKKVNFENLVFVISHLNIYPILKILVSTPHNYPLIMGGRHNNF